MSPAEGANGSLDRSSPLDVAAGIEALARASWSERRELVSALAERGDGALGPLVAALCGARDDETRIAALVDALVASRADVERALVALAASGPDAAILADVAQILGRRRKPAGVPALVELTQHADDNVAAAAIEALGRTASHRAVDALVACAQSEQFFRVFPAIDALGRSGDPRAVAPLARLLGNRRYAFEAARALGRTADRLAVAPLFGLLSSPSSATVRIACLALSDLCQAHAERYGLATAIEESLRAACSPANVRRIGQSLTGADRGEVLAICRVLAACRAPAAAPYLLSLLDGEPEVARAAAAALRVAGRDDDDTLVSALRELHSARRSVLLPIAHKRSHGDAAVGCLEDPDPAVRVLACEALTRIGDPRHVPALFARLEDESARVVHAATAAIQALGSDQTDALALAAARAPRVETRRAALRILAYFGRPSGLAPFVEALDDRDAAVRQAAVQGLALLEEPRARQILFELAKSDDARRRAAAVRALGQGHGDEQVLAGLRAALNDGDGWVRYYACQALGRLRDLASVAALAARLSDEAGQVRVAAIEALSHLPDEIARAALRAAAGSNDPDVRRAALLGIGLSQDVASLPLLLEAAREAEPATRLVALAALASFDAESVVPSLGAAARDQDETIRTAAISYLASARRASATEMLIALVADAPDRERVLAALSTPSPSRVAVLLTALHAASEELAPVYASCLSRLRDESSESALVDALASSNRAARLAAAHSLSALGSRAAAKALARAARDDADPEVRRVCALHLAS